MKTCQALINISFCILLISDSTFSKGESSLISLAHKDFNAFLHQTADAAAKARNVLEHLQVQLLRFEFDHNNFPTFLILQAVTKTINSQNKNKHEFSLLQEADLSTLKLWRGQISDLTLIVGEAPHRFLIGGPETDDQWIPINRMLPMPQGQRLNPDWDSIEENLIRPLRDGAALSDFTIEGPLDIYLKSASQLQLWLPHSVEFGEVKRVLLRAGAAITVKGARSVALRRPVDLPTVTLQDFVDFALEDKDRKQAAGLMHLGAGLREQAIKKWNSTSSSDNSISPALVALEVEFITGTGSLLAAPDEHGALRRLKVRKLGNGVLELTLRGEPVSVENSQALSMVVGKRSPYVWPLQSSTPETVDSYEKILREVLARQVFGTAAAVKGKQGRQKSGFKSAKMAEDLPLKLHRTTSEAALLMQLQLTVTKRAVDSAQTDNKERIDVAKKDKDPPTSRELFMQSFTGGTLKPASSGGHEVYSAVVKVEGSARDGTLKFSPIGVKLVEVVQSQTATFAPEALPQLVGDLGGLGRQNNGTLKRMSPYHDEF